MIGISPGRLGAAILAVVASAFTLHTLSTWPHAPTWGLMLHGFGVPVAYQQCGFHTGQDWFAPTGAPVFAVEDGVVLYVGPLWVSGPDVGRGNHAIVIAHGDFVGTYSHNARAHVRAGATVRRGDRIGDVGAEGYATLPHLHFERVTAAYSGFWQVPFDGCDVYADPGWRFSIF